MNAAVRESATEALGSFLASYAPTADDLAGARRSLREARRARIVGAFTSSGERFSLIERDATGGVHTPSMAAWRDAALIQSSGMDDAVEYGSGGAAVWAALTSLPGVSDDETLVSAGAIGLRLALAVYRAGKYQETTRGFSGTGVFGVLAATAACASALDLDESRGRAAMTIAASQAQGLSIDAGYATGVFQAAAAARDGVISAMLAADGFTGAADVYEARQGFGEAFFGLAESRLDGLASELDKGLSIDREIRFKAVPGHIDHQRPIRALRSLIAESGAPSHVLIEGVPPTSGGNRFSAPATAEQALHSVRHALARVAEHGTVSIADLEDPRSADLARVEVRSSSRWDARLLDPAFAAWAVTTTASGGGVRSVDPGEVPASVDEQESAEAWRAIAAELTGAAADELAGMAVE